MRYSLSQRRRGFTMIEMLIVFVVFGAAAMISIGAVGDTLRRDRVTKVAAIVSSDIEQAFAIAAQQRQPVRVITSTCDTCMRIRIVSRSDTTLIFRKRSFKRSGEFPLDFISVSRDTLDIMPSGLATDTFNLTLGIYSRGGMRYTKSVRSTIGGLVRVDNR
ncbi:MAG: Tfp pilus assembly protein FimT/FimU [Gemmatimonadaceae bacterium]